MSNVRLSKNFTAGGAIAAYRMVRLSAAETIVQASGPTDAIIGTTLEIAAAAGERADAAMSGIVFVEAGGAVALGGMVTSDASGRAVAVAPAAGVNNRVLGFAVEAAVASGDVVRVMLSQGSFQE